MMASDVNCADIVGDNNTMRGGDESGMDKQNPFLRSWRRRGRRPLNCLSAVHVLFVVQLVASLAGVFVGPSGTNAATATATATKGKSGAAVASGEHNQATKR